MGIAFEPGLPLCLGYLLCLRRREALAVILQTSSPPCETLSVDTALSKSGKGRVRYISSSLLFFRQRLFNSGLRGLCRLLGSKIAYHRAVYLVTNDLHKA